MNIHEKRNTCEKPTANPLRIHCFPHCEALSAAGDAEKCLGAVKCQQVSQQYSSQLCAFSNFISLAQTVFIGKIILKRGNV